MTSSAPDTVPTVLEGVDVSSRITDPCAVAGSACFVYQKATDGVGSPSSVIIPNANALRAEGLSVMLGAYHFLRVRAGRAQDADEQCKEFLDMRARAGCPLVSWLDVEWGEALSVPYSNRHASLAEIRAAVVMFIETWSRLTGDMLAWYSSWGEAQDMGLVKIPELRLLQFVLADYEPTMRALPPFTPSFWQYAGDVPFAGVEGRADRVRFLGAADNLKSL